MVTERFALFVLPPLFIDGWKLISKLAPLGGCVRWAPKEGTEIVVVALDGPHEIIRITGDAFGIFHFANAFEEDGNIVFDAPIMRDMMRTWRWLEGLAKGERSLKPEVNLHRVRVDLRQRRVGVEQLSDFCGELPRISPRVETMRERFVYSPGFSAQEYVGPENVLAKIDIQTGQWTSFHLEANHFCSEAVFVPKSDSRAEDDGYALSVCYDAAANESYLGIFDARRPDECPLARVRFGQSIPPPIHATWAGFGDEVGGGVELTGCASPSRTAV